MEPGVQRFPLCISKGNWLCIGRFLSTCHVHKKHICKKLLSVLATKKKLGKCTFFEFTQLLVKSRQISKC